MLRIIGSAILVAVTGTSFSQTQPNQTTPPLAPSAPAVTPSQAPAATPSQTPAVTPSQTPVVTPSETPAVTPSTGAPVVGTTSPAPTVQERSLGGLSKCENLLGFEKDKCMQQERAAASPGTQPAGTGGTQYQAPAAGTQNPAPVGTQNPAPATTATPAPAGTTR